MHRLNLACLSSLALASFCFNLEASPVPARSADRGTQMVDAMRDRAAMAQALDKVRPNAGTTPPRKTSASGTSDSALRAEKQKAKAKATAAKDTASKTAAAKTAKKNAKTKKRKSQNATKANAAKNSKKNSVKAQKNAKKTKNTKNSPTKTDASRKLANKRVPRRPAPPLPEPKYTPLERELKESLSLEVVDLGPYERWQVNIRNQGSEPRRVAADSRLLSFEAVVPGQNKPVQCGLPAAMRPNHKRVPYVYLRPGETHTFQIDPRMYCFAAGDQTTLVPGAFLRPRYGWPEKTKTRWSWGRRYEERLEQAAPFVAVLPPSVMQARQDTSAASTSAGQPSQVSDPAQRPIEGPPPELEEGDEIVRRADTGLKELESEGFALRSEYKGWSRARLPKDDPGDRVGKDLKLAITYGSDAPNPRDVTVVVELENLSDEQQRVYFRSDLVSFRVRGPDGSTDCEPVGVDRRAPDPQAFTNIAAGKRTFFTVRLLEFCPAETFARPGFYYISAVLPATERGTLPDEDVFTGRLATSAPRPVRLHQAELPFLIRRRSDAMSRAGGASNTRSAAGRMNPMPSQVNTPPEAVPQASAPVPMPPQPPPQPPPQAPPAPQLPR